MDIISREDAANKGFKKYFTGKPCKKGHVEQRRTATGTCLKCVGTYNKSFRKKLERSSFLTQQGAREFTLKLVRQEDIIALSTAAEFLNAAALDPSKQTYADQYCDFCFNLKRCMDLGV